MQAGQVMTSVVVDEDMDENRSREVLKTVLSDINGMLKERLNITDESVNLVRMSQRDFDESVAQVTGAKHKSSWSYCRTEYHLRRTPRGRFRYP